jgi:Protein of unknown function (DUF1592)/Protein of unknown function (DUF1588)/Protein of unknown function (DUF1585)/Protein of unknown function (DUF1595)/Protein of unknown function (DUF1587)
VVGLASCGPKAPQSTGGPPTLRRLTQEQYKTIIADIFGADIKEQGRFDPDVRESGLLAIGTTHVSVTPTNLEQYDTLARNIAAQVLDAQHREILVGCRPASAAAADDTCARAFFSTVGRQLFRRPLTDTELNAQVRVAAEATKELGNFYSGLEASLTTMLESPRFLFREETASSPADSSSARYLDAYSKASRLSFFLWNTSPDDELLTAAANGDLDRRRGLAHQVDRMLESPRLKDGVRAFFSDMLGFDTVDTLTKDTEIYPKFTPVLARQAVEQTLRTINDHLVNRKGDYRDLFTTRRTFLSPLLASIYAVPIGARSGWVAFEFPENDPRQGIATEISFLALHSHPGRSSPTLRGKAVREILLCQNVPTPPANVNFAIVQDAKNTSLPTARERLTAHRTQPTCAGCHKIIDPIGLSLESFDGLGAYRQQENGAQIDVDGQLDAVAFKGAAGLGKTLHDTPAVTACLVNRLYGYATGRPPAKGDAEWIQYLQDRFAADGYRVPDLIREIATSDAFYKVSEPPKANGPTQAESTPVSPKEGKS